MSREFRILHGDVLEKLAELPDESFDGCLCDPPYGLSFMGKVWDHGVPDDSVWAEILRVLKPGAMLLAFGGTRTHHRLMCAIEDGGFEIRDCMMWLYGAGFPKSLDISKAIDKAAGAENIVGMIPDRWTGKGTALNFSTDRPQSVCKVTTPATPEAAHWQGYGTALKPAWEPIIVAMKRCDGTYAENALRHGVAGLNIDGCRIEATGRPLRELDKKQTANNSYIGRVNGDPNFMGGSKAVGTTDTGRWPANVVLDETAAEMLDAQSGILTSGFMAAGTPRNNRMGYNGAMPPNTAAADTYGDTGGASRFFYTAKADSAERAIGGVKNTHPCVKPLDLCAYLAKLILPPERETERRLLVPFSGSGSEIIGALRAGWDEVVGVEITPEYCEIARRRIIGDAPLLNLEATA